MRRCSPVKPSVAWKRYNWPRIRRGRQTPRNVPFLHCRCEYRRMCHLWLERLGTNTLLVLQKNYLFDNVVAPRVLRRIALIGRNHYFRDRCWILSCIEMIRFCKYSHFFERCIGLSYKMSFCTRSFHMPYSRNAVEAFVLYTIGWGGREICCRRVSFAYSQHITDTVTGEHEGNSFEGFISKAGSIQVTPCSR